MKIGRKTQRMKVQNEKQKENTLVKTGRERNYERMRSRDRKKRVKANDLLHSEGMRGERGGTYHYSKNFSRRCGFEKKNFWTEKKLLSLNLC